MTDLSDAKISTALSEAYNTVASGHSGRAREEPQYETVSPALTSLGRQAQGEPEYEQV